MACPLRFVLVGFSLLIAAFAWWRYGSIDEAGEQGSEAEASRRQQPGENPSLSIRLKAGGRTLFDMFSGRYLYNAMIKAGSSKQL
jgi:hypothetical protein